MRLWLLTAYDYASGMIHFATCVSDHTPNDEEQQRVWGSKRPTDKMRLAGHPRILRPPVILFRDGMVGEQPILQAMTLSLGHCSQRLMERMRQTLLADFPVTVMDYEEGYVIHARPFANPTSVVLQFDSPEVRQSFENTQFALLAELRTLLGVPPANELYDLLRYATDYGFEWLHLDAAGPWIDELNDRT